MPKSRKRKVAETERGRQREREHERTHYRGGLHEDDYGYYDDFDSRDHGSGDARYNSLPRMHGASVRIRPSISEAYGGYDEYEIPVVTRQPRFAYGYQESRGSLPYGEGVG